ncbi:collagen-binding domain-containing protein [Mesonia aestuariivivens]|uniref:Choice-of-anchor A family protein n=1 Tax=Mesonia aestuariivivens TaxID=2796128 RepID=A0ABS6W544_9FLAO|nr:collagen-binding domain-containing protein [Mesonia aestuariivivens]MBW2962970.1 choice-of-anchor A family protein [Mesonia aestuariivivens]
MLQKYILLKLVFSTILIQATAPAFAQSPTSAALGYNVFLEGDATLTTNEAEGPIALGNNLTLGGNYQVANHSAGTFEVGGHKIGLLVGGKVNYSSTSAWSSLKINNGYLKIGNGTNSYVWYYDQNNAASNIRITPGANYNAYPQIMLQNNANSLNVGVNQNPIIEGNLIDFGSAFQEMRTLSTSISQHTGNAQLTNPNGQSIPTTNLPNQVKINLQNGINYLNVTGADLNQAQIFTYNQQPSASKVLVINVDAPGIFNWNVWNQAGIGFQNCPYILYNFYNTTTLNIEGWSTIEGTVYAPFADIVKTQNQSNIEGQVIAKSLVHSGGEMHYAIFEPTIPTSTPTPGIAPTADFTTNSWEECFNGNKFSLKNLSHTDNALQPEAPLTYAWDFGDGTTSNVMNPEKIYTAAGIYTISLTTTNTYGSSTKSKQVEVFPNLEASVLAIATSSANGIATKQFSLTNASQFASYTWETHDGAFVFANQPQVSFDFDQADYYEFYIHTVDLNGCEHTTLIPITIESEEVNTGNDGGLESESLGDAVSKQYIKRKKKSIATRFNKAEAKTFKKQKLTASRLTARGHGDLTMLEMFPSNLGEDYTAKISSPTDILDYTIANEVLSVDFSKDGKTRGVVLGVKTIDDVYNHTKASCDRLKGAEILSIQTKKINAYHFLMQAIEQRNGVIEYAISFSIGKNENDQAYSLQSNWYVNGYFNANEVFNFQVWSTNPENTIKLVQDILTNITAAGPIIQEENSQVPSTYVAKVSRDNTMLNLQLRSTQLGESIEIEMDEVYSETQGNGLRYNPFKSKKEQLVSLDIKDAYELDGRVLVNGEIQDVFYHADGNWGLDYDTSYTAIEDYEVSNAFDRIYEEDQSPLHRNVHLKAHSEYDYLTLYKSLLPGNLPSDYTEYKYISFTAKGTGLIELGLVKSSIEAWEEQYKANINIKATAQTYYVPFDFFTSTGTNEKLTAEDLSMLTFTFLPMEAGSNDVDLQIENVAFAKTAPVGSEELLLDVKNEFIVYPNPSQGTLNCLLYSQSKTSATISIFDMAGKQVYTQQKNLVEGRNELRFTPEVGTGIYFLKINSDQSDYGVSKIMIQ